MLPYIHFFGRAVPTYGLLTGVGILLSVLWFELRARRLGENSADFELAFLYALIGTFAGAKLLSVLTQLPAIIRDLALLRTAPMQFLQAYLLAGFVFYGGLYGALLGGWLYARCSRADFPRILQRLMPTVALIHAFGRLGCFCMGCCYGMPSETLGIVLPHSEIAPAGVPLLPVQLYEAALEFVMFGVLARLAVRGRDGTRMLGLYLLVYGAARFALEFFRGDGYRGFLGPLSTSQLISIPTVLFGLFLLLRGRKKRVSAHKNLVERAES